MAMLRQFDFGSRVPHYNRRMRILRGLLTTAALLVGLMMLASVGQNNPADRVEAKRVEIPRYLPLAQQAAVSGEVILNLTVSKTGKVVSVDVVSAKPENWGKGFASMAIDAAKRSEFACSSCSGDTFQHRVTYQFQFAPIPKDACNDPPPPPLSKVDSVFHVTVRPSAWPCVQP
jgi:TonB family protein